MKIRHIATSSDGRRAALGAFEREVEVWDLDARTRISSLDTFLRFGGHRLALNGDGSTVVVGAWEREGVGAYAAGTADLIWQRRDLKRVQFVTCSPHTDAVFVGTEGGPLSVLSGQTGETLSRHRGVRWMYESPYQPLVFLEGMRPAVVTTDFERKLFAIERTTFAFIHAAFSPDSVAVSESGGPVRCFTLGEGRIAWSFSPPAGTHCVALAFDHELQAFFGVLRQYETSVERELVRFDADGAATVMAALGKVAETAFAQARGMLVTADRRLFALSDGSVRGSLPEPGAAS